MQSADLDRHIVIVGAGQAGGCAAAALRTAGHRGLITMLGDEPHPPYERPPLSKGMLAGTVEAESTYLRPPEWYRESHVLLRTGSRVVDIDRVAQRVRMEDGDTLPYDAMLIATGARARRLPVPGADGARVFYLRDIADALALRGRLHAGTRLVVVGAGFIGLEIAAIAGKCGAGVVVLERAGHVLARVAAPEVGDYLSALHRAHGVEIVHEVGVAAIEDTGSGVRVQADDGRSWEADIVAIGVGAQPNDELAGRAGLEIRDGIVVDEFGRTGDPAISAAGDVTRHFNPLLGRHLRLESWQNAQNQAIAVAGIMAGAYTPYAEVPWFWTDQYDINLQMAGAPLQWDRLVWRGGPEERAFMVFHLDGEVPVAAVTVNNGRDMRFARQLIAAREPVDPTLLADRTVKLQDIVRQLASQ